MAQLRITLARGFTSEFCFTSFTFVIVISNPLFFGINDTMHFHNL